MRLLHRHWMQVFMQRSSVVLHLIAVQKDQHLVFAILILRFDKPEHLMTISCHREILCLLCQPQYSVYQVSE